ncbi:MAG: hypothetical protein EB084_09270 [Proteobacteria bacterium]|nr:hypothetical protein [Pseudomonadota bacterium]
MIGGGMQNGAALAQLQNNDFFQALYLKDHGFHATPNKPGAPRQSLTESFAHGYPHTSDGISLSRAALQIAQQQRQEMERYSGGPVRWCNAPKPSSVYRWAQQPNHNRGSAYFAEGQWLNPRNRWHIGL